MQIRTILTLLLSNAALVLAAGCASEPMAPSAPPSSTAASGSSQTAVSSSRFGDRTPGTVYVTGQGLYYDTFVAQDPLPMHGRFQLIANGETEFGPGDPGYLGGRWWEDTNGNGQQDSSDHFFLCPLLPPGRPTP
jgi:hypothetical protein